MASYLLIETKNPLDGGAYAFELGQQLRELKHDVTVYLLQDAVFAARKSFRAGRTLIEQAERGGLTVLADTVSARQRGVTGDRVSKEVRMSDMPDLVQLLMERADKAVWH
jgi:sulfur relay protein TusB/DsrH